MKKTWMWSAAALAGLWGQGAAQRQDPKAAPAMTTAPVVMGCDTACCNNGCCEDNCRRGGLLAGVEFPVLWLHQKDASHLDSDVGLIQVQPEFDAELSIRLWGGFVSANGFGARVRYWHMGTDDTTITYVNDDDETINVTQSYDFTAVDFEGLKQFSICGLDMTLSGGVRYGRVGARGLNDNTTEDEFQDQYARFEGWGPTVALEGVTHLGDSGLGVFAMTRGSLLFGDNTNFVAIDDGTLINSRSDWDLVPVLEMQVGVEYAREMGRGEVFARFALEGQIWIEATKAGIPIPPGQNFLSEQERLRVEFDDTLGLVGFTLGAGIRR